MPISKSAKKSWRVSVRKTAVNRHRKAVIKEALKNVSADSAAGAISMIDKGAKWGIFHPNKAARLKGQIAKKVGTIKPKTTKGESVKAKATTKPVRQAQGGKAAPKKVAAKKTTKK
ncbi:MAG TPA: 30S ribosomal protein S20 [Candidatus Saccharimonadales bacterium]|nr:30S ribosomal protein S20 [Candidatus Saccharimonadales bacterium]